MHPPLTLAGLFLLVVIVIITGPQHHVTGSYDVTVTSRSESEMKTVSFRADLEPHISGTSLLTQPTQRRLKGRSPNLTNPTPLPQRPPTHKSTHKSSPNIKDITSISCDWERFNATCPKNLVIIITRARYGRMNLNRCVTKDYGHVGCGDDVTHHMEIACSGRVSCDLGVISLQELMASCPREFKAYVEVHYHCVPVLPAMMSTTTTTMEDNNSQLDQRFLQQQTHFLPPQYNCPLIDVSKERADFPAEEWEIKPRPTAAAASASPPYSGLLSSYVWLEAFKSDSNKEPCPWILNAATYQRINFTLIDFSLSPGYRRCLTSERQDGRHDSLQHQQQCQQTYNDSINNDNDVIQDCHPYVIFGERELPDSKDLSLQNLHNFFIENEDDNPNEEEEEEEEEEERVGPRNSLITPPKRGMNYQPKTVNKEEKFKQREPLKKHPPWLTEGEISDRSGSRVHRVCRRDRRESFIYSSTANVVSVMMVSSRYKGLDEYGHFLLKYQVYGCKSLEPPENSWVEHLSVNKAVVHCNSTNRSTLFVCSSVTWLGQDVKCSPSVVGRDKATEGWTNHHSRSTNDAEIFFGILFVIALGVVVGIIVGIFLLVSVLVYQRKFPIGKLKRRRSTYRTSAELDLVSSAASGFLDDEAIAESVLGNQHVHHLPQNCRLQRFQNCYNEQQHHHHHHYLQQQLLHQQGLQQGRQDHREADKYEIYDLNNEGTTTEDVSCCHHGQPFTLVATTESVPDDNDSQYHRVHLQPVRKDQAFHHHYHLDTLASQISTCGHQHHHHHHRHHQQQLDESGSAIGIQDGDDPDNFEPKKSKLRDPSDLVRSTLQTIDNKIINPTKEQISPKIIIDCRDQLGMISNNSD